MKQIKKIVLRDATKLTNSEMKKIRGGANGEPPGSYSTVCSAVCYNHTGAVIANINVYCAPEERCESYYENGVGKVKCINKNYGSEMKSDSCPFIDFPPVERKL